MSPRLVSSAIALVALFTLPNALALGNCCADLEEQVAELEATLGSSDGIEILDDGQIVGVGNRADQSDSLIWVVDDQGNIGQIPISFVGDFPLILSNFDSTGVAGDAPSVTVGGVSQVGVLQTQSKGLTSDDPIYLDLITDAWDEIADLASLNGCEIASISVRGTTVIAYHPRGSEAAGTILAADDPVNPTEDGRLERHYQVFIHCTNRESYFTQITITHPALDSLDDLTISISDLSNVSEILLPGQKNSPDFNNAASNSAGKTAPLPTIMLPPGMLSLTSGLQAVMAYFGQAPDGQSAVPTIVRLASDQTPLELFQIVGPAAAPFSDLQLCSHQSYHHLWLTWTDLSGNGQLARVVGNQATLVNLGTSGGTTSLTCDVWGNAVAATSNTQGSQITLAAFAPDGSASGTMSLASAGGFTGMTIAMDMNSNGEIAIAWRTLFATTMVARATLPEVVAIDASLSGSWNSRYFDGEGFIWDVAEIDGVSTLVLYYFTYRNNNSGRQAWVVGAAPIVNGIAVVPVAITNGATFGTAFDSNEVNTNVFGEIEVRLQDCRSALMLIRSPLFGDHRYPAEKFTNASFDLPGICASSGSGAGNAQSIEKAVSQIDGSFTGSYFNPMRNFEGFIIEVTESNGAATVVVYWFTYTPDGSGRQMWLVGAAPIDGDGVTVSMVRTDGGQYGPAFDPDAIDASAFVTVSITWTDCDNAAVMYQVDGGESAAFNVQRLAALPTNAGGVCSP